MIRFKFFGLGGQGVSGEYTYNEVIKMLNGNSGMIAYLSTMIA